MKNSLKIICRNSRLSLIQGRLAQQILEKTDPSVKIEIVAKPSRGDLDTTTPLYQLGDKNIFTQDIEAVLWEGKADFAVHSLKDVSAEKLADPRLQIAIFDREDPRDVVIFNKNIEDKLKNAEPIRFGTSSLRREELIPNFLKTALPKLSEHPIDIQILPIRGNVDTRLRKLKSGEFDAIALAAAGLNRLLQFEPQFSELLADTRLMLLPLSKVPPAVGQGALIIECLATNLAAVELLKKVNKDQFLNQSKAERAVSEQFGGGCHQRFGVVNTDINGFNLTFIKGKVGDRTVDELHFETDFLKNLEGKKLVSATDFMRDFFSYENLELTDDFFKLLKNTPNIFVAHHRTVAQKSVETVLKTQITEGGKIWVSGDRTWRELAKKGIWITGSADGFGFEYLRKTAFSKPLTQFSDENLVILTNENAAKHWSNQFKTAATYRLLKQTQPNLEAALSAADVVFWTNFEQYEAYKNVLKSTVVHACPSGKTAHVFRDKGFEPLVFPSINAFLQSRI